VTAQSQLRKPVGGGVGGSHSDAVYGAFSDRGQIDANGKQVVAASVAHRSVID
jgi:hypothetical protein